MDLNSPGFVPQRPALRWLKLKTCFEQNEKVLFLNRAISKQSSTGINPFVNVLSLLGAVLHSKSFAFQAFISVRVAANGAVLGGLWGISGQGALTPLLSILVHHFSFPQSSGLFPYPPALPCRLAASCPP